MSYIFSMSTLAVSHSSYMLKCKHFLSVSSYTNCFQSNGSVPQETQIQPIPDRTYLFLFSPTKKKSLFLHCYLFIILIIIRARNLGVIVDSSLLNLISILKMFFSLFFLLSLDFIPLLHVFSQFLNLVSYLAYFLAWLPFNLHTIYREILQKYKFANNTVALKILPWFHTAFRKKSKFFSLTHNL